VKKKAPGPPRASRAFEKLAAIEPGLEALRRDCWALRASTAGDKTFCANAAWSGYGECGEDGYRGLRGRLKDMVGHRSFSGNPVLTTDEAERVAYQECYDALPDCRGCGPFC
jgi:hypothetical protein